MRLASTFLAFAAVAALVAPAGARPVHYRHLRYVGGEPARMGAAPRVIRDVLVANPYGDVIITGKTGFHRSDFGVMVPDTDPPPFVASGRASGSGLGANGLPGSNQQ